MGMIMQINVDLQISTEMEICPSMALNVWQVKKKLDDTQSSITKCVILAIHVRRWIRSTDQRSVSQKEKHDDLQTPKKCGSD